MIIFLLDLCTGKMLVCIEKLMFIHSFIQCIYGEPTVCQAYPRCCGNGNGQIGWTCLFSGAQYLSSGSPGGLSLFSFLLWLPPSPELSL